MNQTPVMPPLPHWYILGTRVDATCYGDAVLRIREVPETCLVLRLGKMADALGRTPCHPPPLLRPLSSLASGSRPG